MIVRTKEVETVKMIKLLSVEFAGEEEIATLYRLLKHIHNNSDEVDDEVLAMTMNLLEQWEFKQV